MRAWQVVLVVSAGLAGTALFLDPADAQLTAAAAAVALSLAMLLPRRVKAQSPVRPGRLLGAGVALLVMTEVLRPVGGAFPGPAEALTVAAYPFLLAGLIRMTRARTGESLLDYALVAAVPIVLGAAAWLPLVEALTGWAPGPSARPGWSAGILAADVLVLTVVLRLVLMERGRRSYQLLAAAVGCLIGAHAARAVAVITDVIPAPFGAQTLLVLGFGLTAAALLHPSRLHALEPTAPRPSLRRGHLVLLSFAVLAGPASVLLQDQRPEGWMLVAAGCPLLVCLLVLAHLARLLRDRVQLEHASTHDPLTALPNRAHFHELLTLALEADGPGRRRAGVMFIDLDNFKNVNDRLGHAAGDGLLREVAARLLASVRAGDVVARLGGDEFAVLLGRVSSPAEAMEVAERIRSAVGTPIDLPCGTVDVTPSVGIALAPDHGADADTLVRNADSAMYRAKSAGRDRVQIYDEGIGEQVRGRLGVQSRLRTAIEQDELVLHYQPKVDLRNGAVAGVEALVRWQHPTLGLISPGAFIEQAEQSGLIAPLGEWVMRTACSQAAAWRAEGLGDIPVSVNISPRQFSFQDVSSMVASALQESGLPPHLLEMELTESVRLDDQDAARAMRELETLGVQCSIDDFGTGYSSISYLHDYRIDTIKIDRSFVAGISRNERDGPIVRAVIAMAHNLGMRVVAEGVETAEQTEFLRRHGCDLAQGFLFGRPASGGAIRSSLSAALPVAYLADRPLSWDERELGQRLWLEEPHPTLEPQVIELAADSRLNGAARAVVMLTAASGVVVPVALGVGAAGALPPHVQAVLTQAVYEAGATPLRATEQIERRSVVLSALGLDVRPFSPSVRPAERPSGGRAELPPMALPAPPSTTSTPAAGARPTAPLAAPPAAPVAAAPRPAAPAAAEAPAVAVPRRSGRPAVAPPREVAAPVRTDKPGGRPALPRPAGPGTPPTTGRPAVAPAPPKRKPAPAPPKNRPGADSTPGTAPEVVQPSPAAQTPADLGRPSPRPAPAAAASDPGGAPADAQPAGGSGAPGTANTNSPADKPTGQPAVPGSAGTNGNR